MRHCISEGRAIYEDYWHGMFSKKLAEWAISNMEMSDPATKTLKPIVMRKLDDVKQVLQENKVELPNEFAYTAWYLFNMCVAGDPDGMPENVLDCFVTKMCNAGVPIMWEEML